MRMENALGSVQCLVEGLNGWGSDNVRIIIQGKNSLDWFQINGSEPGGIFMIDIHL